MKIICHLDTFGQCLLLRFEKIKEFNMPEGVQMTKKIPFANVILLPVQVLPQQKKSLQKRKPMNAYFLFSRNENRTYTIISNSYCPPRSWGLSVAVSFIHCKYFDDRYIFYNNDGVNRSSWFTLFLLQNFMNIDGMTLILFFSSPPFSAGPQK